METYLDQFCDVADIQYGAYELKKPYADMDLVKRFVDLARLQLHAAAAIVTGGYDFRGAVQSAVLSVELALKAGAAARGMNEDQIREKFGHRLRIILEYVAKPWTSFDVARVGRVIDRQPLYVANRYSSKQPNRLEIGHTVMGAQFVVAEVIRQMTDRDFRSAFDPPLHRRFPE
jgi:hypothetical protein